MIRITDLSRQYQHLKPELDQAIVAVCQSGIFIKGPTLERFEKEIAHYLGVPFAVGVNSGTDALYLALRAAGIGPGDEVITTAMSFIATAEAISMTGATPVFVDIRPDTECLSTAQLSAALSPRTRALLPVHLHGYPCAMTELLHFAKQHHLKVIEDCAQSIGATYQGQALGSLGDLGCFSFFPTKNLGAFGDGGLITTHQAALYQELLRLREHGSAQKNQQITLGVNSRLDALQAAVLQTKLPYLDQWNHQRREAAARYHRLLTPLGLPLRLPPLSAGTNTESVFHHYILRLLDPLKGQREHLQEGLKHKGVESLAYYPLALHQQQLYVKAGLCFPEAEDCAQNSFALPLFPEISATEQAYIVNSLASLIADLGAL